MVIFCSKWQKMQKKRKKVWQYDFFCVILQPITNFALSLFSKSQGKMLEWLKRHAWKACKRQKRFRGSNPRLSANGLRRNPRLSA